MIHRLLAAQASAAVMQVSEQLVVSVIEPMVYDRRSVIDKDDNFERCCRSIATTALE
jgi:hypothetical protein